MAKQKRDFLDEIIDMREDWNALSRTGDDLAAQLAADPEDEVFYDHLHYQDYTFALDEDDIFTCTNGTWHKLSHAWNYRDSSALATLCHEIDRQFRDAFHTKSPLKDAGIDSAVESLITGVIASVLEERKKAAYEAAAPTFYDTNRFFT